MATQVEVGSALAPLAGLSEPSERPAPLSRLEGRGPRPATMTPATPRPRLTPRPFCRERSAETFAVVRPPVPTLKPSAAAAPKPSVSARTLEDVSAARGATGSVPPLLDHTLVESKAGGDVVANMPFYSSPQANTVILFETGSADRVRMTLTPDRHLAGGPRALGTPLAQEGTLPPSQLGGSHRRPEGAGIQRQLSLSAESRPGPWNPGRPLERTEAPAEKAHEGQRQPSGHMSPASGGQPKPRPVSALFLESVKDPKHCAPDMAGEKPPPEQPRVRKPRPLSVDLTARFENRDLSVPRQSCPSEVKERVPPAPWADVGHSRPSEAGPTLDVAGLGRADPSKPALKTAVRVADSLGARSAADPQTQKPPPSEAASWCHSAPKDLGQASAKDRKCLWEPRRRGQEEPAERDTGRGQAGKERAVLGPTCPVGEASARAAGAEGRSARGGGGVKKLLGSPDPSASGAAPAKAESLPASPDKESRILNIQQRIKELTADSAEAKPGNLRRSFRSRPLSADLTKLFSSSAGSSDRRSERQAEPSRRPLGETQEVPESEARPPSGPDGREARGLGLPWKPQQAVKTPRTDGHLEKDSSFARERPDVAPLQAEGPPSPADRGPKPPSTAAADAPRPRTVRATVFEHSVQRHNVAVDRLGAEPGLQPVPALAGGQLGPGRELRLESQAGAKEVPPEPADASLEAERPGRAAPFPGDAALAAWEKLERPPQRPVGDSWQSQRIEPRYEVLQTVGERVRSEAVAAVAEDKAVTLRSRRSLRERRRTEEAAPWPGSLDLPGGGWREDGSASRTKEPGEAAGKRCSVQRRDVPPSQPFAPCEQTSEWKKSQARQQQQVPPSRNKDVGAAGDAVSSLSSEREKEKPDACLADRTGGSRMLTRFPERFGARPGCEVGANTGESVASAEAGEQEGPSSPGAASQWPTKLSGSKGSPAGVDTRTGPREAPRALGLQKAASAHSAKGGLADSGCLVAEDPRGLLGVEEGVRRSPRGGSNPKAADRWRRRTLPHGAAHLEDARALAAENAKALSRRDSLQPHSSSLAKRHRGGAEPQSASPSRPGDSLNWPRSPSEPRAASGAGIARGPDKDGSAADPLQRQPVPLVTETPLLSPGTGPARRPHRQPSAGFADPPGSLERQRSKSWGEGGAPDLPRPGDARGEPPRHLGGAPERGGALSRAEPTPPSRVRPLPQDRSLAQGKGCDGYRPRVLDIDALMAEYTEDSTRGVGSLFPWEKPACRRNSADKASGSYNLSSPKGPDPSPGSARRGLCAATDFHWPENLRPSEQERVERCTRESSPLKARDAPLSPPHWGRLGAERPKYPPADPTRTRKKTFILDEDCSESFLLRHPQARSGSGDAALAGAAHLDVGLGAGHAGPRPSQALPEGVFRKGVSPAQQAGGLPAEESCRTAVHASSLDRRRGGAEVGFRAPGASPVESSTPESGLASAPHDLRRSYSEKVRQTRVRGGLPVEPGAREGAPQSSLPGRADGWPGRRGMAGQDASFRDEERDREGEWPKQVHGGAGVRSPPFLPARRRSRSFYKERRTDHWAADRLKECLGRPAAEAKDTDTLVQEADSQYGTWSDQRHSGDSFAPESPSSESRLAPARKQPPSSRLSSFSSQTDAASAADQQDSSRDQRSTSLDRSSTDVDSADGTEGPAPAHACPDFSFLDHTPVLDSSALKTRVQLSKRLRQRRAPTSRSLRRSTGGDADRRPPALEEADSAWMFQDCTEVKPAKRDDSEQEEEPEEATGPVERSPGSQPQRLPVFPGMDHSVLKAQLRKRQEAEGAGEAGPAQPSKSPKSPFQARASGARVLPAGVEKEERSEESSPQWLRELKSKKRQSHHENQV